MSRVGKKIIELKGVTVKMNENQITVKGNLGELSRTFDPRLSVEINGEELQVKRPNDEKEIRSLHGLTRALIQNMVTGVSTGFSKKLDIVGVGYRAELKDKNLLIFIGYSHPIYFIPPDEIKIEVPTPTSIIISGIDRELVGLVAAKIRSFRKPEPYKGKGIKYSDEIIIRKAGKTAAGW